MSIGIPTAHLTAKEAKRLKADAIGTINGALARELGPDEFWALMMPDGLMFFSPTATKDFLAVPRLACELLDVDDWDEITGAGCYIGKVRR